ncbi:hypothetical protein P154DRAFT_594094, partial [Amniculicola lignicola CBS 123094]
MAMSRRHDIHDKGGLDGLFCSPAPKAEVIHDTGSHLVLGLSWSPSPPANHPQRLGATLSPVLRNEPCSSTVQSINHQLEATKPSSPPALNSMEPSSLAMSSASLRSMQDLLAQHGVAQSSPNNGHSSRTSAPLIGLTTSPPTPTAQDSSNPPAIGISHSSPPLRPSFLANLCVYSDSEDEEVMDTSNIRTHSAQDVNQKTHPTSSPVSLASHPSTSLTQSPEFGTIDQRGLPSSGKQTPNIGTEALFSENENHGTSTKSEKQSHLASSSKAQSKISEVLTTPQAPPRSMPTVSASPPAKASPFQRYKLSKTAKGATNSNTTPESGGTTKGPKRPRALSPQIPAKRTKTVGPFLDDSDSEGHPTTTKDEPKKPTKAPGVDLGDQCKGQGPVSCQEPAPVNASTSLSYSTAKTKLVATDDVKKSTKKRQIDAEASNVPNRQIAKEPTGIDGPVGGASKFNVHVLDISPAVTSKTKEPKLAKKADNMLREFLAAENVSQDETPKKMSNKMSAKDTAGMLIGKTTGPKIRTVSLSKASSNAKKDASTPAQAPQTPAKSPTKAAVSAKTVKVVIPRRQEKMPVRPATEISREQIPRKPSSESLQTATGISQHGENEASTKLQTRAPDPPVTDAATTLQDIVDKARSNREDRQQKEATREKQRIASAKFRNELLFDKPRVSESTARPANPFGPVPPIQELPERLSRPVIDSSEILNIAQRENETDPTHQQPEPSKKAPTQDSSDLRDKTDVCGTWDVKEHEKPTINQDERREDAPYLGPSEMVVCEEDVIDYDDSPITSRSPHHNHHHEVPLRTIDGTTNQLLQPYAPIILRPQVTEPTIPEDSNIPHASGNLSNHTTVPDPDKAGLPTESQHPGVASDYQTTDFQALGSEAAGPKTTSYIASAPPTEHMFSYQVKQKLWSSSETETLVHPTHTTNFPIQSLAEANREADNIYLSTKHHHPTFYNLRFEKWTSEENESGYSSYKGTYTHHNDPTQKHYFHKIWVERSEAYSYAARRPLPSTSFISSTVYILRLCRLVQPDTDSSDSDQFAPPPIREFQYLDPLNAEIYTSLYTANRAAMNLQIQLSHKKTGQSRADQIWQEEDKKALMKKVEGLDPLLGYEGEGRGVWESRFNGLGGEKFELKVERVGLTGPRNL